MQIQNLRNVFILFNFKKILDKVPGRDNPFQIY